ncbi:slit homolog 2 protein-like [Limulus polyphemus]|uniref:Slit homolog 2 protein-like n=1 Tax=Limulus polyphemus TaxID=6850 RepID=A0ABM1TDH8_LIMPO|nr:slit homolog 2 protein-like [Limulus polyphemus]
MSFNHITGVANFSLSSPLRSLKTLVLSHNNISIIADYSFVEFPCLTLLNLSHNVLETLSEASFQEVDLEILDLSWNMLTSLPETIFLNMSKLRDVKFAYNLLQFLPPLTWKPLSDMVVLHLEENYFICDCHIQWLANNTTPLGNIHGWCSSPKKYKDKKLTHVARILDC